MHGASSVPANVLPPAPLHPSGLPLPLHQSSEISPFRPSTEKISTLRPTIASQMSDALEEAGVMDDVQDVQGDGLDDISMFDPEKKSSVSIEDAQRSLSSEGSGGGGDVSALQESRRMSVSFAPMHKVIITTIFFNFLRGLNPECAQEVSVLATPQIPAGGSRYVEKDGNTKKGDGEMGPQSVRRMSQVCNRKI